MVGPSYADIAKKYKGNKKAVDQLGGQDPQWRRWRLEHAHGPDARAKGQVNEAEAKQLVTWILTTK
ncbi:MAG: hypothetical protein QM749_03125 [Aquabacterium sp.]